MPATSRSHSALLKRIARLGTLWHVNGLPAGLEIIFSARMRRSIGRCYPHRRVICLASRLLESAPKLFDEALAHEAAHLAVYRLHGRTAKPHGKEWRTLMEKAGYGPRSKVAIPCAGTIGSVAAPSLSRPTTWVHRCPICQMTRVARRPMRAWRCHACSESGMGGRLEITSRPRMGRAARSTRAVHTAREVG